LAAIAALLALRCATAIVDSDVSFSGRALQPGQAEVEASAVPLVASGSPGVGYGLGSNWELRGRFGTFGFFGPIRPLGEDSSVDLLGASVGARKGLKTDGDVRTSFMMEAAGFSNSGRFDSTAMTGGWLAAGFALSHYPFSWLGLHLVAKTNFIMTNHRDWFLVARPGIGVSFEPWLLVARIMVQPPRTVLFHANTPAGSRFRPGIDLEIPLCTGIQLGLRWPSGNGGQ
jgi:hypothetical protein